MPSRRGLVEACNWLLAAMLFLNAADCFLTPVALRLGRAFELNGLIDFLMKTDMRLYFLIKLTIPTVAVGWAWWRLETGKWNPKIALPVLSVATLIMTAIVGLLVVALAVPA